MALLRGMIAANTSILGKKKWWSTLSCHQWVKLLSRWVHTYAPKNKKIQILSTSIRRNHRSSLKIEGMFILTHDNMHLTKLKCFHWFFCMSLETVRYSNNGKLFWIPLYLCIFSDCEVENWMKICFCVEQHIQVPAMFRNPVIYGFLMWRK